MIKLRDRIIEVEPGEKDHPVLWFIFCVLFCCTGIGAIALLIATKSPILIDNGEWYGEEHAQLLKSKTFIPRY